jgi:hypothetical protein
MTLERKITEYTMREISHQLKIEAIYLHFFVERSLLLQAVYMLFHTVLQVFVT